MQEDVTLERGFGKAAGRFFQGCWNRTASRSTAPTAWSASRVAGAGASCRKVVTTNGLELAADAVVIGAGVTPDIALAKRAGLADRRARRSALLLAP